MERYHRINEERSFSGGAVMKYFRYTHSSGRTSIWVKREDGAEKCLGDAEGTPTMPYNVVLYNPTTRLTEAEVIGELHKIESILDILSNDTVWIETNGDKYSEIVKPYVTHKTLPREKFLGLLKNCHRFITNSSSMYYEAQFLLKPKQIISIGERNAERESRYADMSIPNASDNIIRFMRKLNEGKI